MIDSATRVDKEAYDSYKQMYKRITIGMLTEEQHWSCQNGCRVRFYYLLFVIGLDVTVSNVLPLLALVQAVEDSVKGVVECAS